MPGPRVPASSVAAPAPASSAAAAMDEAAALEAKLVAFRKRLNDASDSMLRDEQRQDLSEEKARGPLQCQL